MSTARSAPELLHAALQDLHAGKADQAERLPVLAATCSDATLADAFTGEARRVADQADLIRRAGIAVDGPDNLWMAGVLDDAERDTRQTEPGRLLDIALIGAIRKGKAAEIVAWETAIALASEVKLDDLRALADTQRSEDIASDRRLAALLATLSG
jgi:ferritin-like metal-binding protein YciE